VRQLLPMRRVTVKLLTHLPAPRSPWRPRTADCTGLNYVFLITTPLMTQLEHEEPRKTTAEYQRRNLQLHECHKRYSGNTGFDFLNF